MLLNYLAVILFTLTVIGFGIAGMRKTQSFTDFFLGGGKIGPIMSAFTYGTAYFSAVLFIGFAGKIGWGFGYSGIWIAIGNAIIGVFGVWLLLGAKIKRISTETGVTTLGEYFEHRYSSKNLKLYTAICIFIFFIPYSAAVFMGLSYLFQSTFNLDYTYSLVFMGVLTAIYLSMGGYKSMSMLDVFFGIIMISGIAMLLMFVLNKGDGIQNITTTLSEINPKLVQPIGPPGIWQLFALFFLTSVAPFAMPQLIQKFYAIKDYKSIKIGMYASTIFATVVVCSGYFIGSTTRVFLNPTNAPNAFKNGLPEFDALMPELLTKVVPEGLTVVILLLILSASMSTLAALVLISSSAIVKDFYKGFINTNAPDQLLTKLMRILSAVFVLLSVILAYFKPDTIITILGISWGAIGSAFIGPLIWGIYLKRSNRYAAWTASVLGLATCLGLYLMGMSSPESGTIGMIVSLAIPPLFLGFRS